MNAFFIVPDAPGGWIRMYRYSKSVLSHNVGLFLVGLLGLVALGSLLPGSHRLDGMSPAVLVWWSALCVVSLCNIGGWRLSAAALARRKTTVSPATYRFQRWQVLLSAVYVFGCAFRSALPRADVQRIGLVDSWMSSVLVGRSVATVAELCFVAQWALLLHHCARDAGARRWEVVSWLLVPLIAVAETCSWYAVLTTSYAGNAIEESIWAVTASLVVVGFLALWPRCRASSRPFLAAGLVLGLAYVVFMATVDVPMYVSRWLADEASGRQYLSLSQGLWDVHSRWIVTFRWEEWRTEMPWMSLYFSVGVWCSLALIHVPGTWPSTSDSAELGRLGSDCSIA
jgi:hypothetical protein